MDTLGFDMKIQVAKNLHRLFFEGESSSIICASHLAVRKHVYGFQAPTEIYKYLDQRKRNLTFEFFLEGKTDHIH